MLGAMVKQYWAPKQGLEPQDVVTVSVMPCLAKKSEAEREPTPTGGGSKVEEEKEMKPWYDVDYVITTRELIRLLHEKHVHLASLPEEPYDSVLGVSTGAAVLFGASGGVMEAALRTAYTSITGEELLPDQLEFQEVRGFAGVKEATIRLSSPDGSIDKNLRVAVANGIGNAHSLIEAIEHGQIHYGFVEVMACPGGCVGGGGQPKTEDPLAVFQRMQGIYQIDRQQKKRKSHENPDVLQIYRELLGEPNSEVAETFLHTQFHDRSRRAITAEESSPSCAPPGSKPHTTTPHRVDKDSEE